MMKLIYAVMYIAVALPSLSYARYLHDEEENTKGAWIVFTLVIVAGVGMWQVGS